MIQSIASLIIFIFVFLGGGCSSDSGPSRDYREDMRAFVIALSEYARTIDPGFIVIPQNGHELATLDGEPDGDLADDYLNAISGGGQEDFNYGYEDDGIATPADEKEWMKGFLDVLEDNGKEVLVTDYCIGDMQIMDSYVTNNSYGYIAFATEDRDLATIPTCPVAPYNGDTSDITTLSEAKNFLYVLDPEPFGDSAAYLSALQATYHDLLIIDLFDRDGVALESADVSSLKTKNGGGARLVIAYMSIGEAEDYRYYWQPSWEPGSPDWLGRENPDWEGNYKVGYWDTGWQDIIFGNDDSYLKKILDAGFDGVYLDIIDAYEYYE